VTNEYVCWHSTEGVLMGKMNGVVRNSVGYLRKWSFRIIAVMSIFHVGLAYIHARESGGATRLLTAA
jgi:hypothetical protein